MLQPIQRMPRQKAANGGNRLIPDGVHTHREALVMNPSEAIPELLGRGEPETSLLTPSITLEHSGSMNAQGTIREEFDVTAAQPIVAFQKARTGMARSAIRPVGCPNTLHTMRHSRD